MKPPFLIQRGKFTDASREAIKGIDSLIRFGYMGSAEFEFGALPASLRRMDGRHSERGMHETPHASHDGERLYLVCAGDLAGPMEALGVVVASAARFKEPPLLKERLTGKGSLGRPLQAGDIAATTSLWWDIENDWIAVLGRDNAERLCIALDRLHDRWSKEKP